MISTNLYRFLTLILVSLLLFSCDSRQSDNQGKASESINFTVQITDRPNTFCNPFTIPIGSERARRSGEPVVVIHQDDYYLFITGLRGYWYSANFRDWTYVDAPDLPGGCPSVVSDGETMYASGDKTRRDVFASADPKSGVWEKVGYYDREYGDANMFLDDDGRLYMYWGWSQVLPFQVVELDPKNGFREKGEAKTLFFGDYESHGFERRRSEDVIFPFFRHRPYFPEESPWIEGPWVTKHNGKYYLQYAAIGLEFSTYSHGVYVSDSPMGPFEYSPHNPLTFKTTGYMLGAGHGSTFHDKNGQLWTIAMVPSFFAGRGNSELALFPTAVNPEGIMYSNTAFGDYPQYLPGVKQDAVDHNFTGWMLLSHKKRVEVSSTQEGFYGGNAVDENFLTYWSAESGDPDEYLIVDLGKQCDIYALQVNFEMHDVNIDFSRGFRWASDNPLDQYQSFTIHHSNDMENWTELIDKSNSPVDDKHHYTELHEPAKARYVKVTNVFTPDEGKFAIKDFRIFGNPDNAKFSKVEHLTVYRDSEDRRNASLLWEPVSGADGYIIRYGIEPNKLYNSYMVYDDYSLKIHSLNRDEEYYFEVEAFDSGTDYYKERTEQTMGRGAEIDLVKGDELLERKMIKEGQNEYVFENITPGEYRFSHTFGPNLWMGELTEQDLIGAPGKVIHQEIISDLGTGNEVLGQMEIKIVSGEKAGKFIVSLIYENEKM